MAKHDALPDNFVMLLRLGIRSPSVLLHPHDTAAIPLVTFSKWWILTTAALTMSESWLVRLTWWER